MTKHPLKRLFLSTVLILFCGTGAFAAEILTGQPLVILDPGHDKKNPGIERQSGAREFTVTLELARHLSKFLSDTCRVRITRTSDDALAGDAAPAMANREKADLFLSLHIHGSASAQPMIFFFDLPEAEGTDTWQTRALLSQAGSKQLATTLANAIKADRPDLRPQVLSGPVLPLEGLNMPGILVEPFALSQIPDSANKRDNFLESQARILADAVLAFLADNRPES